MINLQFAEEEPNYYDVTIEQIHCDNKLLNSKYLLGEKCCIPLQKTESHLYDLHK